MAENNARPLHEGSGSTPVPDPTVLTTAALTREIYALREILEMRIDGQQKVFEARLAGMDTAIELLQNISDRLPVSMDNKVSNLRLLHEEKFSSIQTQFVERDTRSERESKDNKVAVDAALQAAKEAVGKQQESGDKAIAKSEAATIKQIDQINTSIGASNKTLDDKIDDVKERITRLESEDRGHQAAVTTQQTSNMNLVSVIGLVVGALIGIGGLLVAFVK